MEMPDLAWAKVDKDNGLYFMTRAQYDMSNAQL